MPRIARQPDLDPGLADVFNAAAGSLGAFVLRNPVVVGGAAAFAVTLFFVTANAVWYQPGAHGSPLFATRDFSGYRAPEPVDPVFQESRSRIVIRDDAQPARPAPVEGGPEGGHPLGVQHVLRLRLPADPLRRVGRHTLLCR